ncbi:type VII secretion protein EssA [Bacillus sp. FJAT-42376]|uniref:type VII secretion protein EssA n=1 Tax=Bacillus sp. FJAT-42376 TaxID=2014076 RepID=UPI0013DD9903|nr:type VII secretion protein EssA [Bacillus sp. FJAT-42376]
MNQTKKMRKRAVLLTALLLLIQAPAVQAEEQVPDPPDIDTIAPNVYEKKEIKKQTDYFHEETLYQKKYNAPEELKNLDYLSPDPNKTEKQLEELFTAYTPNQFEVSNVAVQTVEAGLFMDSEEELFQNTGSQELEPDAAAETKGSSLTILYIAIIGIGLLLILLILIPRLTAGKKEEL